MYAGATARSPAPSSPRPWSPDAQHGGPSALLLHAIEAVMRPDSFIARVVVDFFRVVPIAGELRARVEVTHDRRRNQRLRASLWIGDIEVAQSTEVVLRQMSFAVTEHAHTPWPAPQSVPPFVFPFFTTTVAYHSALDVRIVHGTWGAQPIHVWLRPAVTLVAGETTSPFARVMAAADAQNGLAPALDITHATFINPDLTVYFARAPVGEWIGCDTSSVPHAHGVGLVQSELRDERGVFGRALQSLLLDRRAP